MFIDSLLEIFRRHENLPVYLDGLPKFTVNIVTFCSYPDGGAPYKLALAHVKDDIQPVLKAGKIREILLRYSEDYRESVLAIYGSDTIDGYVTKHYYIEMVDADNQYPKHLLLVDRAPSKRIRFIQFR